MENCMNKSELKPFLDEKVQAFNAPHFIATDPIQIPHQFEHPADIELAGFLTALISWGNRKAIIQSAQKMMDFLHHSPHDFVMNHSQEELNGLSRFTYRTFQGEDFPFIVNGLKQCLNTYGSLEQFFVHHQQDDQLQGAIAQLHHFFFQHQPKHRSAKHIANPAKGSSAKRINMFLRWMIRKDPAGVDFGIWKNLNPSQCSIPLDVHSGRVARKLGLLQRKSNDQKAVKELDQALRQLDPIDPVKYDFALFGLGVFEGF